MTLQKCTSINKITKYAISVRYMKAVRSCRRLISLQRHPVINFRNILQFSQHTDENLRLCIKHAYVTVPCDCD